MIVRCDGVDECRIQSECVSMNVFNYWSDDMGVLIMVVACKDALWCDHAEGLMRNIQASAGGLDCNGECCGGDN